MNHTLDMQASEDTRGDLDDTVSEVLGLGDVLVEESDDDLEVATFRC